MFQSTIKAGGSSPNAIKILKGEGISYRYQNMLEDFRRAGAISRVKDGNIEGQMKALDYFNKVVEPYRKENGLTSKQAWSDIHRWKEDQEQVVEEAERLADAGIKYGFGDTPTFEEGAERLEEYAAKYGYHI